MDKEGWVKLHRKFKKKGFYKNSRYVHLWVHLLLSVNHAPEEFLWNDKTIIVREGQFVTGRRKLSMETRINQNTVQKILKFFEMEHQIEQKTNSKFRLITILNWKNYQLVPTIHRKK